jgi:hypothetical protein
LPGLPFFWSAGNDRKRHGFHNPRCALRAARFRPYTISPDYGGVLAITCAGFVGFDPKALSACCAGAAEPEAPLFCSSGSEALFGDLGFAANPNTKRSPPPAMAAAQNAAFD